MARGGRATIAATAVALGLPSALFMTAAPARAAAAVGTAGSSSAQSLGPCTCSYFGAAVAVSGSIAAVGEPSTDDGAGRVFVYSESGGAWSQTATLSGADTGTADGFGSSVALSGSTLLVGAPARNGDSGVAYVFSAASGSWTQTAELTSSDTTAGDWFGGSVSLDGGTAVVGAPGHGAFAGAAYVFTENADSTWSQAAELSGPGSTYFGFTVNVAGTTAIVGAPGGNTSGDGRAFIFDGSAGWASPATTELAAPSTKLKDYGSAVAVSGTLAVVGAWSQKTGEGFVYTYSGGSWAQTATLSATNSQGFQDLGSSVVIAGGEIAIGGVEAAGNLGQAYLFSESGALITTVAPSGNTGGEFVTSRSLAMSGGTLLMGGPGHASGGDAYLFTQAGGGWTETRDLTSPDPSDSDSGDAFGSAVAVDGATAVVGAPGHAGLGRAYLLALTSYYTPPLALDAPGLQPGSGFGAAAAVSGSTALFGAPAQRGSGSAYVFAETSHGPYSRGTVRCTPGPLVNGNTEGGKCRAWPVSATLVGSDSASGDRFGAAVAISGMLAVVGAPGHSGAGAVYVFTESSSGVWTQAAELTGLDTASGDGFGTSVSVGGGRIVVGAPGHAGSGAVYVSTQPTPGDWTQSAELAESTAAAGDQFGSSVSISSTGATIAAGAPGRSGAAYIFTQPSSGVWSQTAQLSGADTAAGDAFGTAVATTDSLAVVGAPDHGGGSGAVYVFGASGGWSQVAERSLTGGGRFGSSIGISGTVGIGGAPLHGKSSQPSGSAATFSA